MKKQNLKKMAKAITLGLVLGTALTAAQPVWAEKTVIKSAASGTGTGIYFDDEYPSRVSWGDDTTASGNYATAWGAKTTASSDFATAFGNGSTASNDSSTAWGVSTIASGYGATAWGDGATASALYATAFGDMTVATGDFSTAFGVGSKAEGMGATAWGGHFAVDDSSGAPEPVFYSGGHATGIASTAFGIGSVAEGVGATAWGGSVYHDYGIYHEGGHAMGDASTAFGENTYAGSFATTAWGSGTYAGAVKKITSESSGMIFEGNLIYKNEKWTKAEKFMYYSDAVLDGVTMVADTTDGYYATAFGEDTLASGYYATAFGFSTEATASSATAFGQLTEASGRNSTAFGDSTIASGESATAFGVYSKAVGSYSTAFGISSKAGGSNSLAALGGVTGTWSTDATPVYKSGGTNAVAIGQGAVAKKDNSVAIGQYAVASLGPVYNGSTVVNEFAVGGGTNGGKTYYSQITGVAYGVNDHDAATYGQIIKEVSYNENTLTLTKGDGTTFTATISGGGSGGECLIQKGTDYVNTKAIKWGYETEASYNYSTAFGDSTTASGYASTAFGVNTDASNYAATAFGEYTTASGDYATAFGSETVASSYYSTAFGKYSQAGILRAEDGLDSREYGVGATAWGLSSRAGAIKLTEYDVGDDGDYANRGLTAGTYDGKYATAFGAYTVAIGYGSTAFGVSTTASGYAATAFGSRNEASATNSTAFGYYTEASGANSTAFGFGTVAGGYASTAFGDGTVAGDYASTAFGSNTEASGRYSTAFGRNTEASGSYSTAFGSNTEASGWYSTAYGENTFAVDDGTTAWGYGTYAGGITKVDSNYEYIDEPICAGDIVYDSEYGWIKVTDDAISELYTDESGNVKTYREANITKVAAYEGGEYSTTFGVLTSAEGSGAVAWGGYIDSDWNYYAGGHAIGKASTAFGTNTVASGDFSTAFGDSSKAGGINSLAALGAVTGDWSGVTPTGGANAVAIGLGAVAKADNSIAIGQYAVTGIATPATGGENDIINEFAVGGGTNGGKTYYSQITGVANGVNDHDAATYGQVKNAVNSLSYDTSTKKITYTTVSDSNAVELVDLSGLGGGSSGGECLIQKGTNYETTKAVKWGDETTASGDYATAFGDNTTASGDNATAFGSVTTASGSYATAFGVWTAASGEYSTAFGGNTNAIGTAATAFGMNTNAIGTAATAFGSVTTASGSYATAFGGYTNANGDASTAFGLLTNANGDVSTAFGIGSKAGGENSLAALGGITGEWEADENGDLNYKSGGKAAVAFGEGAVALKDYTYAIGQGAKANETGSIAIGNGALVNHANSVALGSGSVTGGEYEVSVGSVGSERKITNVAYGVNDHDAATYGQLKTIDDKYQGQVGELGARIDVNSAMIGDKADRTDVYTKGEVYKKDETEGRISAAVSNKADTATTLSGYGISDAYTKSEVDAMIAGAGAGAGIADIKLDGTTIIVTDANGGQKSVNLEGLQTAQSRDNANAINNKADKSDVYTKDEVYKKGETEGKISEAVSNKADRANSLAGYGITDAYTKIETDGKISEAINTATSGAKITGISLTGTTVTVTEGSGAGANVQTIDLAGLRTAQSQTNANDIATLKNTVDNLETTEVAAANSNVSVVKTKQGKVNTYTVGLSNTLDLTNAGSVTVGNALMNNNGFKVGNTKVTGSGISFEGSAVAVTADGINAGGKKITNVAEGTEDSDAATVGQVNRLIGSAGGAYDELSSQVNRLGNRIDKVGAGAAALSALHPLDFDPDNKLTFSAGLGNYRSEKAAAVGMFYRPTDRVMFSMGATMGNDNNMVNTGLSFALDRKIKFSNNVDAPQLGKSSREALVNEVHLLAAENTKLSDKSKNTEKEMKVLQDKIVEQNAKMAEQNARMAEQNARMAEQDARIAKQDKENAEMKEQMKKMMDMIEALKKK